LDTARNPEAGLSLIPNASTNRVALVMGVGKQGIRKREIRKMASAGYSLSSFLFSLFCSRLRRETAEPSKKIMNNMERRRIYLLASMPIQPIGSTNELHFTAGAVAVSSRKPSEVEREVMGLFEEFRNPLLRYVLSFGIPVHDAEEVVQEVFLALFRHLQIGRSRDNLRGWLFRVGHNLALKQRQTNRRLYEVMAADSATAEKQCDPAPNPEEQVSFAQRRRRLLAVLNALPEEDQCCLRLRAEGLRYREIASVLGISLGAVSTSLARSLARFVRAEGS
jgi:RNA polymerase sigma-70 factor, ECF subfamily